MRRTRPGRPWRQGPFVGDSGRGKSPGNPTVTWFPSRSRYGRAAEAPRRGQRSALRTAPLGCPSNTGTRVAFLSSPEVTPLRDWPERPPRHPVPPPSDMDPDTRAEPLPSVAELGAGADWSSGQSPRRCRRLQAPGSVPQRRCSRRRRCGRSALGAALGAPRSLRSHQLWCCRDAEAGP